MFASVFGDGDALFDESVDFSWDPFEEPINEYESEEIADVAELEKLGDDRTEYETDYWTNSLKQGKERVECTFLTQAECR